MEEKLLYAIIDGEGERSFSFAGLDDARLETFFHRDVAAVASSIDRHRFKQACPEQGRRGEEERLRADTLRYQQVNLRLLEYHTVVPMRFGFIARDREHIEEVLEKIYLQLRTLLNRLKGKVELVIQASWGLKKILQEIAAQDESIVQAKREASRNRGSTGSPRTVAESGHPESFDTSPVRPELVEGRTINEQQSVVVGKMLFEAAEARKKEFIAAIHGQLCPLAEDFSDGPRKDESMILNRSYLVQKEKERLFDEVMNRLGTEYDGYLTFRYIGPLPAYSFVNIELNQGNFAVVDRARRVLGLPEKASLEMIKAAYRSLALTSHPDRHREDPQAEERFRAVTHAYEVLEAYCRSSRSLLEGAEPSEYSFARENVERVFIVKGKGALHAGEEA